MNNTKKTWDFLPNEKRKLYIEKIISFFREQRDEEIGVLAAENILDFFLENIGPEIYNLGIEKTKELLKNSFNNFEIDLDSLKKI